MKRLLSIGVIGLIGLAGCVNTTTVPTSSEPPLPAPAATATAVKSAPEADASNADSVDELVNGTTTLLTFEGQGDTFLEAISEAMSTLGEPTERHFWEGNKEPNAHLQGEILIYPEQIILFAQLSQNGGTEAVRIESVSLDEAVALLSERSIPVVETTGVPDAAIAFVRAQSAGDGIWNFDVSIDHPDTGWEDYADGWHVETPDGIILGTRILFHPHVGERPFTRSMRVEIPAEISEVHIRSHDLVRGYGYETVRVPLGEAGSGEKYEVRR